MDARQEWTSLHQAAWNGAEVSRIATLVSNGLTTLSRGQSPLLLAMQRWSLDDNKRGLIDYLWSIDPAPQLARWGDTAWGGGLSLLDLCVQKDLPQYIEKCKLCGLIPHERTWSMALLHDSDEPLITLGLSFELPNYLPHESVRIQKMLAIKQAISLEEATEQADGGASSGRRL